MNNQTDEQPNKNMTNEWTAKHTGQTLAYI